MATKMSNSQSKEESEEKSTSFTNHAHESDNDLSNSEIMYQIIVAGGQNKKSVEHIFLPANLQVPKGKNVLTRLWSAILRRKSSNSVQKWSYLKSMIATREMLMTGIYKDQMFAIGGIGTGRSFESLDLNDPRAQWQDHDEVFQQDLFSSAAVVYGGSAYIFGGTLDRRESCNIYRLSLAAPYTVELIGQMPEPRSYHNAEIFEDKVIILGGSSGGCCSKDEWLDSVLQYDITTNSFKTLPPLPAEIIHAATATWKDNVVIVGGVSKGVGVNPVLLYNISSGESQRLPPMRYERTHCAAVVAGDMLVVLGGLDEYYAPPSSEECYNFMTNKWTELPPMKLERFGLSAVVRCWDAEKAQTYKAPEFDEKRKWISCREFNPECVY